MTANNRLSTEQDLAGKLRGDDLRKLKALVTIVKHSKSYFTISFPLS